MKYNLKKYVGLILAISLMMTLTACGGDSGSDSGSANNTLSVGDTAPDFTVELAGGGKFSLSENSGKVILINLWATWCGPCVREMPAFEKLNAEYSSDEVSVICVNCGEDPADVDSFIKQGGYTFPIAYDKEANLASNLYPTDGIPHTVVVGKDGKIKQIYIGAVDADKQYEEYKSAIDQALGE